MEFTILGPLEARVEGRPVDLGGLRQRKLLAVLLLNAGRVVARDRLIEAVWGEDPPTSVQAQVPIAVSALRRALRVGGMPGDLILTEPAGYRLDLGDAELDALVFERRVAEAHAAAAAGEPAVAVERFRAALAVWRGPALAGVADGRLLEAAASGLEERRLAALEACIAHELELGRDREVLGELARLIVEHPFRERLRAQLMLALYRTGRQTEALEVYRSASRMLREELGLEPGEELQELERAILAGSLPLSPPGAAAAPPATAGPPVVPAQLPADLAEFTGRADFLERLGSLLPAAGQAGTAPVIWVIAGTAGVGKTALAVHWAHQVAGGFPDGQLFVNLNGYAPSPPVSPVRALAQLLHGLGVEAEKIPVGLDAAAAMYRSLLAGKRMLVVLDNAREAEQVRPLLPGSPGCVVLITSRDRLTGLVATHSVRQITLGLLDADEAVTLLARLVGDDRVAAEPQAVQALARACAYLPLALRIAAANLTGQPDQPIADYVEGLQAGDRLAGLSVEGDPQAAVLSTFDRSYQRLAPDAQRLFRLLGLVPGPELSAPAGAALAAIPTAEAGRLLRQLASAHLLETRGVDRFAFHDLLRLYAHQRCERDDGEAERQAAVGRLLDWYLQAANAAAELLYPQILRLPLPPAHPHVPPAAFDDHTEALAWLDTERANLVAAITHAAGNGPRSAAWLLADALRGYFWLRRHTADGLAVAEAGLVAAVGEGDDQAQAAARFGLGDAHQSLGRYPQTIEHYTVALTLARQAGWVEGEAATLGNLGNAYGDMGSLERSADYYAQALALDRQLGRLSGQANTLCNLGVVYRELGRLDEAAEHYTQGLELFHKLGAQQGYAMALGNLGDVDRDRSRLDRATEHLTEALALMREAGDRNGEAYVQHSLAAVMRDLGRHEEALELAKAAVALADEVEDRRTEAEACNTLGGVHLRAGRVDEALATYCRALGLARGTGTRFPETSALLGLAAGHLVNGQLDQALDQASQALAIARQAGYQVLEGQALTTLAEIHLAGGRTEQALEHAHEALAVHRRTGHRLGQARTLVLLGRAGRDGGAGAGAGVTCLREALALFTEIGVPEADQLRELLDDDEHGPHHPSQT